jgi:uncharacterized membrane protein (DUF485 family)
MLHGENTPTGPDLAAGYKSKLGVKLFIVYALVYVGFVAINVVNPKLMETKVALGLNLAVVYGMGLIVAALLLALIYDKMCGTREAHHEKDAGGSGASDGEGA